jgi:glycosyltransferase involved in cell wall biosynthesis
VNPTGLVISACEESDRSAYTHRLLKLSECLKQRSIGCDLFFMADHFPLDKETTASLFLPFRLATLKKYDFIHCGAQEVGQALFFCRPFLQRLTILDMHGDVVAQSALANEIHSSGRRQSASLRVKLIDRMALACADHILTVSTHQTNTLLQAGYPSHRVTLIRNGVDLEQFRELQVPVQPEFTFGYIGEFQTWQGVENLIAALERLKDRDIRTRIIGFREEDQEIRKAFQSRLGSRVELIDRTDRKTMIEMVKSISILLIPRIAHRAIWHAFPTKFAEYAAMGRPIMVNDVDETADFVRKYQCGFVSRPHARDMADTMMQAAETPHNILDQMGNRARKMAEEHFSWDRIGDQYAKLIHTLTSDPRRQPESSLVSRR